MAILDEIQIDGTTYNIDAKTLNGVEASNFIKKNELDFSEYVTREELNSLGFIKKTDIFPVGSIYISLKSTNPSSIFGGTWEQIKGRFLLGVSSSHPVNQTGGEESHTLTVNEMPSHQHNLKTTSNGSGYFSMLNADSAGSAWVGDTQFMLAAKRKVGSTGFDATITTSNLMTGEPIGNTGGGQSHNNMPPYLAVYMWKRTA